MKATTQTMTIHTDPTQLFLYIADPERLPEWAPGFAPVIRRDGERWIIVRGTREVELKMVTNPELGIIDFHTELTPGVPAAGYSRVIPNGTGCEYVFTQFQWPSQSDEMFEQQIAGMQRELITLKGVFEG